MGNNFVHLRPACVDDFEIKYEKRRRKEREKRRREQRAAAQAACHSRSQQENPFYEDPEPSPAAAQAAAGSSPWVLVDVAPFGHCRSRLVDKYTLGGELGRGEFGVTYLCTDRETREALACKSISKHKLRTPVDVESVRREVAIMSALPDHPNLVRLRAAYEDDEAVHLVTELCEGGELFDRIVARGRYTERSAAAAARMIMEVVRLCHDNGVMHRDLKPENFLYASKKENSALKAIGFGLSVFFGPGERFSEIVGSPYYMAPEVLKRNYGPEVDIWSAGVVLYFLLCGVPPFWDETEQGVAQAILRGVVDFERDPWPQVSGSAKNLVRQMLQPDPRRRLTAQQVLEHPWIQNANVPLGDVVRARLKQFSMMNRFKKKAMQVIAENLSIEEVEGIRNMFELMDTDNDGKITFQELKAGLKKVGSQLGEEEMKMLMEAADVDGNGILDYGEFVAVTIHLQRTEIDEHLRRAFMFFDKDGSGYIEMDELKETLADYSGQIDFEVLYDIMREVDTNKDGRISYEEFVTMMNTGTDWRKASRQYSSERFKSLSINLMKAGPLSTGVKANGREVPNSRCPVLCEWSAGSLSMGDKANGREVPNSRCPVLCDWSAGSLSMGDKANDREVPNSRCPVRVISPLITEG